MNEDTSRIRSSDLVLDLLLSSADTTEAIPITLNVGGLIISGELISQEKYLEEFMYGALLRRILETVEQSESLKSEIKQAAERDASEEKVHEFIHLRNAKFFFAENNSIPAGEGVLWRGPVNSIDGYFFGKLDVT